MVLTRRAPVLLAFPWLLLNLLTTGVARAQDKPRPGEVTLAVRDYNDLVDRVAQIEQARTQERAQREPVVTEVVAQHVAVTVDGDETVLRAVTEVLVRGTPDKPIPLAVAGVLEELAVEPAGRAAAGLDAAEKLVLVAPGSGRYVVRTTSRQALVSRDGLRRVQLGPAAAPVAVFDLDLPAELGWSCPGSVLVSERLDAGRRFARLSVPRGLDAVLELRHEVAMDQSQQLQVKTVGLMLFQLRPAEIRRYDVVLYTVARGALADFEVELPPALRPQRAVTDEGNAQPIVAGNRLVVHRQRQLRSTGFLVLVSSLPMDPSASLAPLNARPAVQASYFAAASTIPATAVPEPASAWSRVDLDDLPVELRKPLAAFDLAAAWRLASPGAALALRVATLPEAPTVATVVRRRDTTTLLSADGTLLHRDRYILSRAGAALAVELPAGATLWSARVGGQTVRPLQRGSTVTVPLPGLSTAAASATGGAPELPVVELVAVLAGSAPGRRSDLHIELPQLQVPVLEHTWEILLPEGGRYRYRGSELRPVMGRTLPTSTVAGGTTPSYYDADKLRGVPTSRDPWTVLKDTPGARVDRVDVGGNESGQRSVYQDTITVTGESPILDERRVSTGATISSSELSGAPSAYSFRAEPLRQGLVGGVKPVAIDIPEIGKSLLLSGVLPSAKVTLTLQAERAKGSS